MEITLLVLILLAIIIWTLEEREHFKELSNMKKT